MRSAGFLLVKRVSRPAYVSAELIPPVVISAGQCICPRFPGPYAIDWVTMKPEDRDAGFTELGVPRLVRDEAVRWATSALDATFGWPSVFFTLDAARDARRRFLGESHEIRTIGLGIDESFVESFIADATEPSGLSTAVAAGQAIPPAGISLGYEPLDLEYGQFQHSWLCNGLERHCADVLGVRPGASGLIDDFGDARRCCEEINREEVGAEPGLWLPMLLTEYR
jgi:hypothetical protein